jgi:dolichol-phosphate mannosyltransferase
VLTIVIPTRDEAANVAELLHRLGQVVGGSGTEVLVVDDSDDGTPDVVDVHAAAGRCVVRCRHRIPGERTGGLGGAVAEGLRAAGAPWVCVMDGDLQHRPEFLPTLLRRAAVGDVDLVVASRYVEAGAGSGLGPGREAGSRLGCALARATLPGALGRVADPLSGFFLLRRSAVDLEALEPKGFKVLVEILARSPDLRTTEVPYALAPRAAGRSKAGPLEAVRLLALLRARRRSLAAPSRSSSPSSPSSSASRPSRPEAQSHERCA